MTILARAAAPFALVLCLGTAPLQAFEMIVFKQESAYRGGALRARSHEVKEDRVLIVTESGDLLSAAVDSVDWERSRHLTEQVQRQEKEQQLALETETRANRAAQAAARPETLSILEASRRYGVDNPGVSVAAGSTARTASAAAPAVSPGAASPRPAEASSPQADLARNRLGRATAERERLAREVLELEQDRNPDPQWAARRATNLTDKRAQLAEVDRRIATLKTALGQGSGGAGGSAPGPEGSAGR